MQLSGGPVGLGSRDVAQLMLTCKEVRRAFMPLAKVLPVNEAYDTLVEIIREIRPGSEFRHSLNSFVCFQRELDCTELFFVVSKQMDRSAIYIRCPGSVTVEVQVTVFSCPKQAVRRVVAVNELYRALLGGVSNVRPNSQVHRCAHSFFCIYREADRTVIHFIISCCFVRGCVVIYCASPDHPYVSEAYPSTVFNRTQFTGRLEYTNRLTDNHIVTAFAVRRAWWLHGLPRNIEGGFAQVVVV